MNPQFSFMINKDDVTNDQTYVIIALMQKAVFSDSKSENKLKHIHFRLYKVQSLKLLFSEV